MSTQGQARKIERFYLITVHEENVYVNYVYVYKLYIVGNIINEVIQHDETGVSPNPSKPVSERCMSADLCVHVHTWSFTWSKWSPEWPVWWAGWSQTGCTSSSSVCLCRRFEQDNKDCLKQRFSIQVLKWSSYVDPQLITALYVRLRSLKLVWARTIKSRTYFHRCPSSLHSLPFFIKTETGKMTADLPLLNGGVIWFRALVNTIYNIFCSAH